MDRACILYSVLFLSLHYATTSALSNNSDHSALLEFKSHISFSSENVFLEKNWSASSSVCSWMGITCNPRHNRVAALNISGMGLDGVIPPHIANLSFLISLDLSDNSFHGNLPKELAQLRRLRLLDLRQNNFTGPIPTTFGSLAKLHFLYLSYNQLSGGIPSSLSNISRLEKLDLRMNFLQGSIPEELGDLRYLTSLILEINQLTGPIPASIFNMRSLEVIAFTNNKLSGSLPTDICSNLPKLKGLYLSIGELVGRIPPSIGKCSQLQVLSLTANRLSGTIPREIGNLTQIQQLFLGGPGFEGSIPNEIGNLQRLAVFGLDSGRLSGSIPASIFNISTLRIFTCVENLLSGNLPSTMGKGMPNLEEIYIGTNNLSGNIPASISNATKLTVLDLSHNNFNGPIPSSVANLVSLSILNLAVNSLVLESSSSLSKFLTSLTNSRNLKELSVSGNPLGGTIPASVANFSNSLQSFSARRCNISGKIPEEIGNLSSLALINLSENDLTGFIPTTVDGLQSLQRLYLDNNKVSGSLPNNICNLPKLGEMELSRNQISGSVPSCIGYLTSMQNLFLSSNNFSSNLPPSLWTMKNLLRFEAFSNSLSGLLPPELGNLKAITLIDLSRNNFSGNIPSSVDGLENLIDLSLAHNALEGPIPDSFGKLISLEALDLSHNRLSGVIPQSLESLVYLKQFNVSFNQLSGQIPNNGPFLNFSEQSFMSNAALCGDPRFQVLPCPITNSSHRRKKRSLLLLCILLGMSSLILASALGFVFIRWRKKKEVTVQTDPSPVVTYERISYEELENATNGFSESNLLGVGSYSSVYEGILPGGTLVAVKVFNSKFTGGLKSFDTECEVLRNVRHRNLTKIITTCSNMAMDFRALVLEHMPNGSLEKWLYSHNYFLDILQRLDIMVDVAYALDYLHTDYTATVVHCDVKPSNVLLDENMVGHLCDFGIAKLLGVGGVAETKTLATIGYIAPEFGSEGVVTTKCDVYSYGIMLMETFTRRRPTDDVFSGDMTLRHWIKSSFPSAIMQIADSNLLKPEEKYLDAKEECLSSIMELALDCTATSPDARIDMQDVLSALKKVRIQFLRGCGGSC
ncbi:unnamed protein product [Coffea canephora]|uniref:non-specific serine/threonine protein kinase n=1 Tax=Coffea canephora TaxID=49390 RepID=A0A068USP7_COFCA|nr:unnamed protein product [Coffea canephora]